MNQSEIMHRLKFCPEDLDDNELDLIERGLELLEIFGRLAVPWGDICTNYASSYFAVSYDVVTNEQRDTARMYLHDIVYG